MLILFVPTYGRECFVCVFFLFFLYRTCQGSACRIVLRIRVFEVRDNRPQSFVPGLFSRAVI